MLFDPTDPGTVPSVIVAMTGEIVDGHGITVSKRFAFVSVTAGADDEPVLADAGSAPHLDPHDPPPTAPGRSPNRPARRCPPTHTSRR